MDGFGRGRWAQTLEAHGFNAYGFLFPSLTKGFGISIVGTRHFQRRAPMGFGAAHHSFTCACVLRVFGGNSIHSSKLNHVPFGGGLGLFIPLEINFLPFGRVSGWFFLLVEVPLR